MTATSTTKVLAAWERGARHMPAIWTDGRHIWSYGTCVLASDDDLLSGYAWVVNATDYSATTAGHLRAIRNYLLTAHNGRYGTVAGLPIGCSPLDVLIAAWVAEAAS